VDNTIEWKLGTSSFGWMRDPYQRGLKAGQLLIGPCSNPFPDGSKDSKNWERGWREGAKRAINRTGRPL
jgi:hypothetical protein